MKKLFTKKITPLVTLLLILALLTPASLLLLPEKAEAGASACVTQGPLFSGMTALEQAAAKLLAVPVADQGAVSTQQLESQQQGSSFLRDCIEHPLALFIAKSILTAITNSIVQWIDGGMNGKGPSFITNPKKFFTDQADQIAGELISQTGLGFLCSPFRAQVAIAIALNYSSTFSERANCTLSSIFNNVDSAFDDFSNGGWAGWISISQSTQNNPYGSYLETQGELSSRIGNTQATEGAQLEWNGGFLSYSTCKTTDGSTYTKYGPSANVTVAGDTTSINGKHAASDVCTNRTPGKVIYGSLQKALDLPQDQLGVADDLDKIAAALGNLLLNRLFSEGAGLLGLNKESSPGAGDGTADLVRQAQALSDASFTETEGLIDSTGRTIGNPGGGGGSNTPPVIAENIALRGGISQAPGSDYQYSDPAALTDGSRTNVSNGTYNGYQSELLLATKIWVQVELKNTQQIDKVTVYPRNAYNQDPIDFYVQVLDATDKVVWQSDLLSEFTQNPFKVDVPANIIGASVRLQGAGTKTGRLEVAEIEVYNRVPPSIAFTTSNSITINVGDTYTPPGATAKDMYNAPLTGIKVTGTVDTSKAGTYTLTYTVVDGKGATGTATATVTVR